MKLIDKDAIVAEIERLKSIEKNRYAYITMEDAWIGARNFIVNSLISFLDTLEVKEVGISIPNIDDTLKEVGLDPSSKEAKIFKENYYMALEKLKAQKGE